MVRRWRKVRKFSKETEDERKEALMKPKCVTQRKRGTEDEKKGWRNRACDLTLTTTNKEEDDDGVEVLMD